MTSVRDSRQGHICFSCHRQIGDDEPHIHVPLDDFAARNGLAPLGLDDLLTFPFCEPCTIPQRGGWDLEAHDVTSLPAYDPEQP
jgi:hypothetical protein